LGTVVPKTRIGQQLVDAGYIDDAQLEVAVAHQRKWGGRLGDAVVALRFMSEPALLCEVARQHGVLYVELGHEKLPETVLHLLPERLIRGRRVLPMGVGPHPRRGPLFLATSEPQNRVVLDEVAFASGMKVRPVLASEGDIIRAIERHLGPEVKTLA